MSNSTGENRYLSTADASRAMGVSVSTVKRWVDDGILPAHKTAGGHRKLLLADLIRLGRAGRLPNLDLRRLELQSGTVALSDTGELRSAVISSMRTRDGTDLRSLLLGVYQSGLPIERIFDEAMIPALEELGRSEQLPGQSHRAPRALQECKAALYELKSILELRACRDCPIAIGGALEGDTDPFLTLMVHLTLLDAAWEPTNLGPNTPIRSLTDAVREVSPRLLWVAASRPIADESLIDQYNQMFQEASQAGTSVVLVGPGLTDHQRRRMQYT